MPQALLPKPISKRNSFQLGALFLFLYWLFGFDGITFSDDVYYLLAGRDFWNGEMEVNAYHFSSRWGAYVPAGLMAWIFGLDPHRISLISWISYVGTLALLLQILPKNSKPWILVLGFSTQVYFLHFLTKVYPDSLLVFWTTLVPYAAFFRKDKPILASLGLIAGLFFGFITKETIIFVAPLPGLLLLYDWKKNELSKSFYLGLLAWGLAFGAVYFGYFWIRFDNPFYRIDSLQAGHYVSEYTYADKSAWVMFKRLTVLPVLTLIERAYWLWVVLSIPVLHLMWNGKIKQGVEFGLAFMSLGVCFWLMTTNLEFYNPLYLNPRHLIILVPIMSFLISIGWDQIWGNRSYRRIIFGLLAFGVLVSLGQQDWKMAGFQATVLGILWLSIRIEKWKFFLPLVLLVPPIASIFYQFRIKDYSNFRESLVEQCLKDSSPILVNNFVQFSAEVLLPEHPSGQSLLLPIEKLDSLAPVLPDNFRVFLYEYYRHAYPKEQEDVERLESWLNSQATLLAEEKKGKVWIRTFRKK